MTNFVTLDDFDHKLLDRVRRNNLEPARVTAEAVGLSESAVLRRLRRLRSEGVIKADVAIVDPARLEPKILIHTMVTMKDQDRKRGDAFKAAMRASSEVLACWDVTGQTDYLIMMAVTSMADFDRFCQRELIDEKNVLAFRTMITISEVVGFDPARMKLSR